jgi:diketogulonate reductase-like aldo/keto reductase
MARITRRSMLNLSALSLIGMMARLKNSEHPLKSRSLFFQQPQKRIIPISGESIPIVGLGTWRTFDTDPSGPGTVPLKDVLQTLVNKAGSVVDSSPMYGASETVVGDLSNSLNIRKKVFLATKVWTTGKEAGIRQMEESFRKMKTNTMDLMQVHNLVDADKHIKTLREWKEKGKIRYWGITHYLASAYPEMMRIIKSEKPDFVQFNYNIYRREAETELLPFAKEKGIAVIINRPFEEGALFNEVQREALPGWVNEYGIKSWAQFFLKFILSHHAVTCTIPGTSKANHLEENLNAGSGLMPDEKIRQKMISHFKSM